MEKFILSNGLSIPANGFGVYQVPSNIAKEVTKAALKRGYRLIDTAQAYGNEEEVGDALLESDVSREEIFLTTKVWINHYGEGKTYESVLESLRRLKTDYLDLILLHQPYGDVYGAYRDLERLYKEGKVKSIGVSNFYPDRLVDLALSMEIKPMVNQIEINPFFQQEEAEKWNDKYGVLLEAWAPFGEGRLHMFENETLMAIGNKYHKTVAQVILRWLYQRGIVSLAKTIHEARMEENQDIYSFALSKDDMAAIEKMNRGDSLFLNHQDPKTVEGLRSFEVK